MTDKPEIKFTYALSFEDTKGYILLSDKDPEKKARELWEKTEQLKGLTIEESMIVSDEIFLGLLTIKNGPELGILIYKNNPVLPNSNDICKEFIGMILKHQEEDY
jgi:hypothetical protein